MKMMILMDLIDFFQELSKCFNFMGIDDGDDDDNALPPSLSPIR